MWLAQAFDFSSVSSSLSSGLAGPITSGLAIAVAVFVVLMGWRLMKRSVVGGGGGGVSQSRADFQYHRGRNGETREVTRVPGYGWRRTTADDYNDDIPF